MPIEVRSHACHDCPRDKPWCKSHSEKMCKGFFDDAGYKEPETWTPGMAMQTLNKNWDGHFRFPRRHVDGKSLSDFTEPELRTMRRHASEVYDAWWAWVSKFHQFERGPWPPEVRAAHELQIDIGRELQKRHGLLIH